MASEKTNNIEIAIVGGGIAGLYCLYRLLKESEKPTSLFKKSTIRLFESSDHLGGRIETWSLKRVTTGQNNTGFEETWDPRYLVPEGPRLDKASPYGDPKQTEYFRAEFGPMRIEPRDQPLLNDLLALVGIAEQAPGANDSMDDLIPFFPYASDDPQSPKFALQGEEGEQKSNIDLLLLGIRRILEITDNVNSYNKKWKNPDAKNAWKNLHSRKSFYRSYWKAELLDWINHLEDGEPGKCTPKNSDYQRIREQFKINGHHLWDLGFWNLMSDVLSHYAVVKVRDWGTYYHFLHENLNAAEWLIFWLKNIKGTQKLRGIRGGMSRLIYALIFELCLILDRKSGRERWTKSLNEAFNSHLIKSGDEDDVDKKSLSYKKFCKLSEATQRELIKDGLTGCSNAIALRHKLNRIELDDGGFRLSFVNQNTAKPSDSVIAKEVILALPKQPLMNLNLSETFSKPPTDRNGQTRSRSKSRQWKNEIDSFDKALNSVKCLPLLKCFFVLENPWWEDDRPLNKYAADIPTREISYYKSKDKTKGLIMIYTDHPAISFWSDYLRKFKSAAEVSQERYTFWWRGQVGRDTFAGKQQARLWDRFVQFARDYEHHDFSPERLLVCGIRDWGKEPFGGAAHGWLPGEESRKHIDYLAAFPKFPKSKVIWAKKLHVCGEAFSDYQGFIEGSLRSAEEALSAMRVPPLKTR